MRSTCQSIYFTPITILIHISNFEKVAKFHTNFIKVGFILNGYGIQIRVHLMFSPCNKFNRNPSSNFENTSYGLLEVQRYILLTISSLYALQEKAQ
jgi:hypothetical protein